jgi:hypothetical protein
MRITATNAHVVLTVSCGMLRPVPSPLQTRRRAGSVRCIERVHQRPIPAQVGNQSASLEFDDGDRIAHSSYTVKMVAGVSGIRADTGRRELGVKSNIGQDSRGWGANATTLKGSKGPGRHALSKHVEP